LSEKLADVIDPAIKYGGGPQVYQGALATVSEAISRREGLDALIAELLSLAQGQNISPEMEARIARIRAGAEELDADLKNALTDAMMKFSAKVGT
jgi:hypothetical protein